MSERRRLAALGAVLGFILPACGSKVAVPEGALLSCAASSDCPSGRICYRDRCVSAGSIDTTPADLASAPVVTPGVGRAGTTFTIDVAPSEPLLQPPEVTLALVPPAAAPCVTSGVGYRCSYTATGSENGGLGGVVPFDVRLLDRSRNETLRKLAGAVSMDFTAPHVAGPANVAYYPQASNPLPSVARAAAGTVVRVTIGADEVLGTGAGAAPTLVAHGPSGAPLSLDFVGFVPSTTAPTGATFEGKVPVGAPDGRYTWMVEWGDAVGNRGSAGGTPDIEVKTSTPTLTVDQDAVVFVRSPWGNGAPEDLGGHVVPAGPYFAMEPADPLSADSCLPAATFRLADGTRPARVLAKLSADPSALLLGTLLPDATGGWPRQALASPDTPAVYVVGVDEAGNVSAPVKIESAEWVATPNVPTSSPSQHQLERARCASRARVQDALLSPGPGSEVRAVDGQAATAQAWAAWTDVKPNGLGPGTRAEHAMAYDAARGRVVLFGGIPASSSSFLPHDTWEWDGRSWSDVTPAGMSPDGRIGHALVYDSARGRTVLFGGWTGSYMQDTWEWDGATWIEVTPAGPSPGARRDHAMAYDSARGRVVLFGGSTAGGAVQDTWEWDGSTWFDRTPAAPAVSPSARASHAMAHDSARGRVVLFGGTTVPDTWEWDGATWSDRTPSAPADSPVARTDHTMAFDSGHAQVVLHGGVANGTAQQDTWAWNGSAWTRLAATSGLGTRFYHALAHDGARGRTVLFGGSGQSGYQQDTWVWDGAAWSEATPVARSPAPRTFHTIAYDSSRGRTVLFGGYDYPGTQAFFTDTWEWDGSRWTDVTPAGTGRSPAPRIGHSMSYDGARGRVVLFGGRDSAARVLSDTWVWDGSSWTSVTPAGAGKSPGGRYDHAMSYDSTHGRVVLFGGRSGPGVLADTWTWDGAAWTSVTPAGTGPSPSARSAHAMAYDSARARVVLFGGGADYDWLQDTWVWDGSGWTSVTPAGSGSSPAGRYYHKMAYDSSRGRVVLFGGLGSLADRFPLDTWEWTGTRWKDVTPPGVNPNARVGHAMDYDSAHRRAILFGGGEAGTWGWEADAECVPALQFDVATPAVDLPSSAITGLHVRAFAGGTFSPAAPSSIGATLLGWRNDDPAAGPGAWLELATNATGVAAHQPYLPADGASFIEWRAPDAATARRFVTERDGRLSFQVRSNGPMGPDPGGAQVALDYVEVRVRYRSP